MSKQTQAKEGGSTVQFAPFDKITQYVHANSVVDLDSMPSTFEQTGRFDLPVVDPNKKRTERLSNGRERELTVDIGWANRDVFKYAWLDPEAVSDARLSGFRPVTRGCEAAYADGKHIPESYFGGKDYISVGASTVLHFAKKSFADSVKESTQKRALEKLNQHSEGSKTVEVRTEDGGLAGGITSRGFQNVGEAD